jgi:hypothetical protein
MIFVYSRYETTLCTDSLLSVTGIIRLAHGYLWYSHNTSESEMILDFMSVNINIIEKIK